VEVGGGRRRWLLNHGGTGGGAATRRAEAGGFGAGEQRELGRGWHYPPERGGAEGAAGAEEDGGWGAAGAIHQRGAELKGRPKQGARPALRKTVAVGPTMVGAAGAGANDGGRCRKQPDSAGRRAWAVRELGRQWPTGKKTLAAGG
jgi:hypothetical protein